MTKAPSGASIGGVGRKLLSIPASTAQVTAAVSRQPKTAVTGSKRETDERSARRGIVYGAIAVQNSPESWSGQGFGDSLGNDVAEHRNRWVKGLIQPLTIVFTSLFLSGEKREKILRKMFGHEVHPTARIGLCFISRSEERRVGKECRL